jgi:hypothetical protein
MIPVHASRPFQLSGTAPIERTLAQVRTPSTSIPASRGPLGLGVGVVERVPSRQERIATEQALAGARQFFMSLGVGPDEGNNDNIKIRFLDNYPNASYSRINGEEAINIGINPKTGVSYGMAADVIAHEYAHRVVRHILGQPGVGEAGAVNESLADTFAAAIDTRNWTIGEQAKPGGIRSMIDPGRPEDRIKFKDGRSISRPDSMDEFLELDRHTDKGGVHLNMGIPNKAAALIGEQLGREDMARIYMDAIRHEIPRGGGIRELATATAASAVNLFGSGSHEAQAVRDAWAAVGLQMPRT